MIIIDYNRGYTREGGVVKKKKVKKVAGCIEEESTKL
jgi:hypothetical protein